MNQRYYFKATKEGGISGADANFVYTLGQNIHPDPDRKSKSACGTGIHLAKTLVVAKKYVPKATEYYLAEAGVILGEDDDKVRCASCVLVRQLTKVQVKRILKRAQTVIEEERRKVKQEIERCNRLGRFANTGGLCGLPWLESHFFDHTQEEIDNLSIVIFKDDRKMTAITASTKKKIVRELVHSSVS